jgi:hypothetical protein
MNYEIIINTDFNKYDKEYLESFELFGDFTFLPYDYSFSLTNAFKIINAYVLNNDAFNNPKWINNIISVYDSSAGNYFFKIDKLYIIKHLRYIHMYGWYTWVRKIKDFSIY